MAGQIIIEVSGGVVTEVYSSDPDTSVVLVDWDTDGSSDDDAGIVAFYDDRGNDEFVRAVKVPAASMAELPQETKAAADAAI